jgi:DNA-binding IscR family transcriptional regulator
MHTSTAIAEELGESAVMVRRTFLLLQKAGMISQRKGPNGGARLAVPAKQIGLGDVYAAAEGEWMSLGGAEEGGLGGLVKKVRKEAIGSMNETTLAQVVKRMRRG